MVSTGSSNFFQKKSQLTESFHKLLSGHSLEATPVRLVAVLGLGGLVEFRSRHVVFKLGNGVDIVPSPVFRLINQHTGEAVLGILVDPGLSLGVEVLDVGNEFVHHVYRID